MVPLANWVTERSITVTPMDSGTATTPAAVTPKPSRRGKLFSEVGEGATRVGGVWDRGAAAGWEGPRSEAL